jgi:hypothetical protein
MTEKRDGGIAYLNHAGVKNKKPSLIKKACHHHAFHVEPQQAFVDVRFGSDNYLASGTYVKAADFREPEAGVAGVYRTEAALAACIAYPVFLAAERHENVGNTFRPGAGQELGKRKIGLDAQPISPVLERADTIGGGSLPKAGLYHVLRFD